MTVQELPLFSCSPRLPPRGHFGNLWHVVLQRGVGGVEGGGEERRRHQSSWVQGTQAIIPPVCETPVTKILRAMSLTQFYIT